MFSLILLSTLLCWSSGYRRSAVAVASAAGAAYALEVYGIATFSQIDLLGGSVASSSGLASPAR